MRSPPTTVGLRRGLSRPALSAIDGGLVRAGQVERRYDADWGIVALSVVGLVARTYHVRACDVSAGFTLDANNSPIDHM